MENKNGISLIALIITIIVIIILAAIVITMSLKTPEDARYAKFYSDMSAIQEASNTRGSNLKVWRNICKQSSNRAKSNKATNIRRTNKNKWNNNKWNKPKRNRLKQTRTRVTRIYR